MPTFGSAAVDVIPECLLLAAMEVGALRAESRIGPVFVERKRLSYAHRVDQSVYALAARATRADDPIARLRHTSDDRFAGRKRAIPVKGVGGESVISCDDIGQELRVCLPSIRTV